MSAEPVRQALELSCPRCGLTIAPRTAWLGIDHCPRCVARARTLVQLRVSPPASPVRNV